MRWSSALVGLPVTSLAANQEAWAAITAPRGEGPLGADRTVTGNDLNEYHVWPAAAAGGWFLVAGSGLNPFATS